jgi:hypothetical protein
VSGFCATIYHQTIEITKCSRNSNESPPIIHRFQLERFNAVVPIWTEVALVSEIDLESDSNEPMDMRVHSNVFSTRIIPMNHLPEGTNSSPGFMAWLGLGNLQPEAQASLSHIAGLAWLCEAMAWLAWLLASSPSQHNTR